MKRSKELETLDGVEVFQLTEDSSIKSNIYCEFPWCSADSRRFVFGRQVPGKGVEFTPFDFESGEMEPLGSGSRGSCTTPKGVFFFSSKVNEQEMELVRVDLATLERSVVLKGDQLRQSLSGITVSPDERYLAYGVRLGKKPARFGIELIDLEEGRSEIICEYDDLHNPHPQFDRNKGRQVLVQHNRGATYDDEGLPVKRRGDAGVGLFLVDVDGNVSPLKVGLPYTADLTGHECWLGTTGEVLTTAFPTDDYPYFVVAGVKEGEAHRVVARIECPSGGGHIGSPPHGRFYTVDRNPKIGGGVFVGSPCSGQIIKVCETGSTGVVNSWGQCGHAHAYLSPDLSKIVFNSLVTGSPQIFMATLPSSLIESLDPTFRQ